MVRSTDFEHMIIEKENHVRIIIPLRACDEDLQGVKASKFELNYNIKPYDLEIVENYLTEVHKRSNGAYLNQKRIVLGFLNFANKPVKKITTVDVKKYFEQVIDRRVQLLIFVICNNIDITTTCNDRGNNARSCEH